jgi:epoxyqueuosine reductase
MNGGLALTRGWLEKTIARLAADALENKLIGFSGAVVFDPPLIGIADGEDPLFAELTRAVGPRHLRPRTFLASRFPQGPRIRRVSIISWVLPFSTEVRESNRGEEWPSPLYSLARNQGQALNQRLGRRLVALLKAQGLAAAAPTLTGDYDIFHSPEFAYSSTWSERHVAFAAGLGRFGLNGSLITPLGSNVRLGSLVVGAALEPSLRLSGTHQAACLESRGDVCRRCVDRCPVGAISPEGLDKRKCNARRKAVCERSLASLQKKYLLKRFRLPIDGARRWSYPLGCALCQCGLPCEGRDPFAEASG